MWKRPHHAIPVYDFEYWKRTLDEEDNIISNPAVDDLSIEIIETLTIAENGLIIEDFADSDEETITLSDPSAGGGGGSNVPEFSDYMLILTFLIAGYAMKKRLPELQEIVVKK